MSDQLENNDYVLEAMIMTVHWWDMRKMCLTRTNCEGCPCYKHPVCSNKNSDQVWEQAVEVFRDFLEK